MGKIKSVIRFFLKNIRFDIIIKYTILYFVSITIIGVMFYKKPRSLLFLFLIFFGVFSIKIWYKKIARFRKISDKIYGYLVPNSENCKELYFVYWLLISAITCDIVFEKNCAIIGCIATVFVFFGHDIVGQFTSLKENYIVKYITTFIAIVLTFVFLVFKYKYSFPFFLSLLLSAVVTAISTQSYRIKKIGESIIIAVGVSTILAFFMISVI